VGSKNKLKRFRENATFANVVQPQRETVLHKAFPLQGQWAAQHFRNEQPIVLELGCGKGEYTVHLASQQPQQNFIGVDIKGARFWRGAKTASEKGYANVAFLRTQIELIDLCFAKNEVSEIWITFPDPQLKFKRAKHRLTHPSFLERYQRILKPGGVVHLKTDSSFLWGYTLGVLEKLPAHVLYAHHDIYHNADAPKTATSVQTFYEQQFLDMGKPIAYLQFQF